MREIFKYHNPILKPLKGKESKDELNERLRLNQFLIQFELLLNSINITTTAQGKHKDYFRILAQNLFLLMLQIIQIHILFSVREKLFQDINRPGQYQIEIQQVIDDTTEHLDACTSQLSKISLWDVKPSHLLKFLEELAEINNETLIKKNDRRTQIATDHIVDLESLANTAQEIILEFQPSSDECFEITMQTLGQIFWVKAIPSIISSYFISESNAQVKLLEPAKYAVIKRHLFWDAKPVRDKSGFSGLEYFCSMMDYASASNFMLEYKLTAKELNEQNSKAFQFILAAPEHKETENFLKLLTPCVDQLLKPVANFASSLEAVLHYQSVSALKWIIAKFQKEKCFDKYKKEFDSIYLAAFEAPDKSLILNYLDQTGLFVNVMPSRYLSF